MALYYSDFGAKGDGVTDDFDAIIATHEYANKNGLPVKADSGASYYIGDKSKTKKAAISTNTDWGDAKFIIDNSKLTSDDTDPGEKYYINAHHIFSIESMLPYVCFSGEDAKKYRLTKGMKTLGLHGLVLQGYTLVVCENTKKKQFRRVGYDGAGPVTHDGDYQIDSFKIDKNGNIDQDAPVIWDFTPTSITFYPIDPNTLTVSGGIFTTICDRVEKGGYLKRGIDIKRSNTIVRNVIHNITNERETLGQGSPYAGFFFVNTAHNVTVKDCEVQAKRKVRHGTYDIYVYLSTKVTFENVKQSNDIMDEDRFGIICMEYAKDVTFDGCELNRFDAHQGVANAKVLNSVLGKDGVNLVGFGTFYMNNTSVTSDYMLSLRPDYGIFWDGDIIVENCHYTKTGCAGRGTLISSFVNGKYYGGVDFGYSSKLPKKVSFDNLTVRNVEELYIFHDFLHEAYSPGDKGQYVLGAPESVFVRDIVGISIDKVFLNKGKELLNRELFKDVHFSIT